MTGLATTFVIGEITNEIEVRTSAKTGINFLRIDITASIDITKKDGSIITFNEYYKIPMFDNSWLWDLATQLQKGDCIYVQGSIKARAYISQSTGKEGASLEFSYVERLKKINSARSNKKIIDNIIPETNHDMTKSVIEDDETPF